jgi:hypothetical protein
VPPGLTKLTDPAGDNSPCNGIVPNGVPVPGTDLLKFQIAQPFQPDGTPRLIFTITTDNGQSPQPLGSSWYVAMKVPVSANPSGFKAVHMTWNGTTPTFESYTPGPNNAGGVDGRFVVAGSQKPAEATSNYLAPFNQVIIVVKASDLGLKPGDVINGFVSGVSQTAGGVVTCLYDDMPDGLGYTGSYTVEDNQTGVCACKLDVAPTAVLTANTLTGKAPLTVNFDASGSFHAPPPSNVITSYTLDFGDGTAPVTQASPMFSHVYNSNGDYPARLTATDPCGKTSTNAAQLVISVGSTFNQAVSHKVHALAGPFDINLPLTGVAGNECRSGGANNDYTIIYTFDRNLFSVGSATVSHGVGGGTGSVSSQTFGPNANQYTVSVTNVSNAQHLSVTLNDVHDSAGAILNNSIARMDVLLGDVDASGRVDSTDVFQVRQQTLQNASPSNFRTDVDTSGRIDSTDVFITRQQTLTSLP